MGCAVPRAWSSAEETKKCMQNWVRSEHRSLFWVLGARRSYRTVASPIQNIAWVRQSVLEYYGTAVKGADLMAFGVRNTGGPSKSRPRAPIAPPLFDGHNFFFFQRRSTDQHATHNSSR
eukprot:3238495-Prymnesium_polylepis.1